MASAKARADRTVKKINKMVREITQWNGQRPSMVRVNYGDYLALTEANYLQDGKLSGTNLEVRPG